MLTKVEIQKIMQSLLKQTVVDASSTFPFEIVRLGNFTGDCDASTKKIIAKLSIMMENAP